MDNPLRPSAFMAALRINRRSRRSPYLARTVRARLTACAGEACGKCEGSGSVRARRDGGVCYACRGRGRLTPPLTAATLRRVKSPEGQERLAAYLKRAEEMRVALRSRDRVLDAWDACGVLRRFSWRRAERPDLHPIDAQVSALNDRIESASERVEELGRALEAAARDGADARADDIAERLREATARALRTIEEVSLALAAIPAAA